MLKYLFLLLLVGCAQAGDYLYPEDFGAKGCPTDDTVAIADVLAASAAKNGKPVRFAGCYRYTEFKLPPQVDIIGGGVGFSTVLQPLNAHGIEIINSQRNRVQGVTVSMALSEDEDDYGVHVKDGYNITLDQVFVFESPYVGIRVDNVNHVALYDVVVYGKTLGQGNGIEFHDSSVIAVNLDVEATHNAVVITGEDTVNLTGLYLERFGAAGVRIQGASNNAIFGGMFRDTPGNFAIYIQPEAGVNPNDPGPCDENTVVGGMYNRSYVHPNCIGNALQ